ncbi:MAG: N-acetyl-gamma-glutamyl-phosphate reductase, partial [Bacteroidetes bacterium]
MIQVGIIGGAGYTAGELIRILLRHPGARLAWVHSRSQAGEPLAAVHQDLVGETELC